jgi:hypothetical protein
MPLKIRGLTFENRWIVFIQIDPDSRCTNQAEEYFSRLRRAEIGIHHHIAGASLLRYAQESSWREDNRRVSNGDQVSRVASLAMKRGKSVDFTGYWQRHIAD